MIPVLSKQESEARVKWLRAHGWKVKRVKLRDGSIVVLQKKPKGELRVCHQCKRRKRRKKTPRRRYW